MRTKLVQIALKILRVSQIVLAHELQKAMNNDGCCGYRGMKKLKLRIQDKVFRLGENKVDLYNSH